MVWPEKLVKTLNICQNGVLKIQAIVFRDVKHSGSDSLVKGMDKSEFNWSGKGGFSSLVISFPLDPKKP